MQPHLIVFSRSRWCFYRSTKSKQWGSLSVHHWRDVNTHKKKSLTHLKKMLPSKGFPLTFTLPKIYPAKYFGMETIKSALFWAQYLQTENKSDFTSPTLQLMNCSSPREQLKNAVIELLKVEVFASFCSILGSSTRLSCPGTLRVILIRG